MLDDVLSAKLSWDEAMGRLDGSYYSKQVQQAVSDYKAQHQDDFKTEVNIKGWDEFQKSLDR